MLGIPVNYLAFAAAILLAMALGHVWYSFLFKKPWMLLTGMSEKSMKSMKIKPWQAMLIMLGMVVVEAVLLGYFVILSGALSMVEGMQTGFFLWLGFVATSVGSIYLFTGRPLKLFTIDAGYHLVSLMGMGAILAVWL